MINLIFWALSCGAVLQSLIALLQFSSQSSIGLHFFGESILKLGEPGVANIIVGGARTLRGYGTFLHPNILGAFLVIGLISLCHLWLKLSVIPAEAGIHYNGLMDSGLCRNDRIRVFREVFLFISIFIVSLGLVLTFSRSAWLVSILSLGALLFFAFRNKQTRKSTMILFLTLLAIGFTLVAILSPFVFPRISFNLDEPAIADRLAYNKLGLEIIRQHPFWGVGFSNQVQYASQNNLYEKFSLTKPWQKQPVHNLYILMTTEIGIPGLLFFLIFIGIILRRASDNSTAQILLLSLLALGLFDHYLWDIWQGQLLLVVIVGMVIGVGNGPRSSTDRMLPSEGSDAGSIPAEDTK